jgi:tRNA-modifying protein YgfZ
MPEPLLPSPTLTEAEQLQAVRERCVLGDGAAWGTLSLTGADRAKFLHNFCSNEIKKLEPGQGCEVFFCNVKGRILALAWVLCQSDRLLVLLERDRIEFLATHLDRYLITEQVEIADLSDELSILFICGPTADEAVRPLVAELPDPTSLSNRLTDCAGTPMTVACWNLWNLPGWMLMGERAALHALAEHSLQSGGIVAGDSVWEYLRISALIPRYGVDLSDDHLAQEANRTGQAISFLKGCYLGQEPIARLDALGHVNRQLERLSYESQSPLPLGVPVCSDSGEKLGVISSSCLIPGTHKGVALAMLKVTAKQAKRLIATTEDGQEVVLTLEG